MSVSKTVYWLRRDLRLHDNRALSLAAENTQNLDFVFEIDASLLKARKDRWQYTVDTLKALNMRLEKYQQRLLVVKNLETFLAENPTDRIVFTQSYNSIDQKREKTISELASSRGIRVDSVDQLCLYQKSQLPISLSQLKSFTPFRKKIEKGTSPLAPIPGPNQLPAPSQNGPVWQLEARHDGSSRFPAGEAEGLARLKYYLWESHRIETYKDTRNGMLDFDDSSKLSPFLALGSLSPRTVYQEIKDYEHQVKQNESTYWLYFELLWRDYFKFFAQKHGPNLFTLRGPKDRELDWLSISEMKPHFKQWTHGKTGQDFIDANMRELFQTGWMSNRGRQNVASFWAKHLFADWRLGARWFERCLIDYDVESNWGNWAYNSGVGSDPRDRKFDPVRQSQMYDADGAYRKRFLS